MNLDLDRMRRAVEAAKAGTGNAIVSSRWLEQAHLELAAGRAALAELATLKVHA